MELFNRRYLTIITFLFALTALLCCFISGAFKIAVAVFAVIFAIAFGIVFLKFKKDLFKALFSIFVCTAIGVSAFSSYFFITRAENEASSFVGTSTVMVKIIKSSGEDSYDVKLLRAGDKDVSIKAEIVDVGISDLDFGDRLIFNAEIERIADPYDRSKLLVLSAQDVKEFYLDKNEEKNYFSYDGIVALCHALRLNFGEYVDGIFDSHGGIVKGLLVNDKSDIDSKTYSDFKRSGTLHILAVSGMHIVLLMGALELLLRALSVKKGIRIIIISLFAIFFLALSAFVASAVRSVLMLFAVYLTYLIYEENDSITALFVSIAIIILFSPFAVYDLGMWMSFLATLGILLVYPHFDAIIPYPDQKNPFVKYSLRGLVWCAKTLMLTIVANFFLLPIMWYFFGELSISSIPCNLVLSPIVTVLMPLCAVATLFGNIPYIGTVLVFLTKQLSDLMLEIVKFFAKMRFGVVSLRSEFASILIIAFTVIFAVMLVIKIKRKLLIFVPMVVFALIFTTCFAVLGVTSEPKIRYMNLSKTRVVYLDKGAECSVVDIGENSGYNGFTVLNNMSKYATEIDEYFITSLDKGDVNAVKYLSKNTAIRNLYIPQVLENSDVNLIKEIFECAEKYNIKIKLYQIDESVEIYKNITFDFDSTGQVNLKSESALFEFSKSSFAYSYNGETRLFDRNVNGIFELPLK